MQSKAKGKGNLSVLMDYAGRRRVLTYLSWGLSAVSALTALVPFIFVWLIVREVIQADGNFAAVQGSLSVYFRLWLVGGRQCAYFHARLFRGAHVFARRGVPRGEQYAKKGDAPYRDASRRIYEQSRQRQGAPYSQ